MSDVRFALILSPIVDDNPMQADTPSTDAAIITALSNSWREVHDDDGNPVAVHEGGSAAILNTEATRAFLNAVEVGLEGIDDDADRLTARLIVDNLRGALA